MNKSNLSLAEAETILSTLVQKDAESAQTIGQDDFKQILELLQNSSTEAVKQRIVEVLGDLGRIEENRSKISDTGIIQELNNILNDPSNHIQLKRFVARAIGNFCYEHKENSKLVTTNNTTIHSLIDLVKSDNEDAQRNSAGAITNLAWENENIQHQFVAEGVVEPFIKLLANSNNSGVLYMVCRAIYILVDGNESNQVAFGINGAVELLFALLEKLDTEANTRDGIVSALEGLLPNVENAKKIAAGNNLRFFLQIANNDDDEVVRQSTLDLLLSLCVLESIKPLFEPLIEDIISAFDKVKSSGTPVAHGFAKMLAHLSEIESIMLKMFLHYQMFVELCRSTDVEVKVYALMTIGNLARRDHNCMLLMEAGIFPIIMEGLEAADVRIQHHALGVVRNLSLPGDNRHKFVEGGVVKRLINLLGSRNVYVLFSTIGLIRHFVMIGTHVANQFIEEKGLNMIMTFAKEVQQEEHIRILYEAARVLSALVIQLEKPNMILDEGGLPPILKLVQSSYPLLQIEGGKAVAKIVDSEEYHSKILNNDDAINAFVNIVSSNNNEAILPNLIVVHKLLANEKAKDVFLQHGLQDKLKAKLQSDSTPQVHSLANEVYQILNH